MNSPRDIKDRVAKRILRHPGRRMAARMTTQTGMLYEALNSELRDRDGRFPPLLALVVYAGEEAWNEAEDLSATVAPSPVPMAIAGQRYRRLDFEQVAREHPKPRSRFSAWARLTVAASGAEAAGLLANVRGWLALADEEEQRLLEDFVEWFHALAAPASRPAMGPSR